MCLRRHERARKARIGWIVWFAVMLLAPSSGAQSMKFTYDAAGNLIERTVTSGAAPQIIRHPRPNVVAPGQSASFVVVVSDTRGVAYQWRLDGVAISGATSDVLFIPSSDSGDEGDYTVVVTNVSGSVTSNAAGLLLDEDDDGLPDSWEVANGVNSTQTAHTDADGDGVSNLDEFFDDTDPTGSSDYLARLNLTAEGGTVVASPAGGTYPGGQVVALTATPDSGGAFYGWSGDVSGATNPINITMNGDKSAVAHFRCTPLPPGASAYWGAETDATDSIGGNNGQFFNGTTVVSPSLTTGRIGNAFNFNGSLHVRGSMPSTQPPVEASVELWIYPTVKNSSYQTVLFHGAYELDLKNGKIQLWHASVPTGQWLLLEGPELPLNAWTHVAGVFSGDVKTLFVNGIPVASAEGVAPLFYDPSANYFMIGAAWVSGAVATPFTGRIDEVGLYTRALYASEVHQIASAGLAPKCGGPYFATPEVLPDGTENSSYSQSLSVVLGTAPVDVSLAVGSLPPGLTLSSSGALSGTPSEPGQFSFIVRAEDSGGAIAEQVYSLTIRGALPPPASLVAWWRGESDATDSAGSNDGTFYDGSTPISPATGTGLAGDALSFDGTVYVRVPSAPELSPSAVTLEAWVYPTAFGSRNEIIARPSGNSAYSLALANGIPRFYTSHLSGANQSLSAPSALPLAVWSHLAATFEDGMKRLYVNGQLLASDSGYPPLAYDSPSAPVTLGGVSSLTTFRWNGKIDEASIYSRALSAGEVHAVYLAGAAGKRDPGPRFQTASDLPDGAVAKAYSQTIVAAGGSGSLSYWVNEGALPPGLTLDGEGELTGTPSAAGTFQFVVAVIDSSLTTDQRYRLRIVDPPQPPAGLVGWWRGESDAEDSAGANDGTFYSGTTAVAPTLAGGLVGGALSFDGTVHVRVPDVAALRPPELTVETWLYPTLKTGTAQKVLARAPFSTGNDTYGVGLVNGVPNFWTNHVKSGAHQLAASSAPLPLDTWSHLGATFDGFTKRLYVNGSLVASAGGLDGLSYATQTIPVTIGGAWTSSGSDYRYSGRLDEVSLYDRALAQAEIAVVFDASVAGKRTTGPRYALGPSLPSGATGNAYAGQSLVAAGGPVAVSAVVSRGAMPPGLVLGSNGEITGTPTASGNYWWEVTVTDANGVSSSQEFDVQIASTLAVPLGAVGWWRAEANASDSIGTNHGTLVNGAGYANGKVGQAFSFDGVDDRVSIAESAATDISRMPAWTIEAWVFPTHFNTNNAVIYSEGVFRASLGFQKTTGKLESWINDADKFLSDTALQVGAWNHVAMTYDATGRTYYVNGNLAGVGSAPAITGDNGGAAIGDVTSAGSSTRFPGRIDEVTLYARALAAEEIAQIYVAGSTGKSAASEAASHFRSDQTMPYAVVGEFYEESVVSSASVDPLTYEIAGGAIPPGLALEPDGTLSGTPSNVGNYAFVARATDSSATISGKVYTLAVWKPVDAQTGLVAWWRAEGNALDGVGSNHGTLQGAGFTAGRVGQAFSFDGVDDRVAIPEATAVDISRFSAFTIEAWVYPLNTGSQNYPTIYAEGPWIASLGFQMPGHNLDSWLNDGNRLVGTPLPLSTWSHVALTYQSGTRVLYLNGLEVGRYVGPTATGNNLGSAIGDIPTSPYSSRFKGSIDELGIYDRALSRAEVEAIYYAGPLGKASAP